MSLKDELKEIDEFFNNMSTHELEDMLIRNGAMEKKYIIDEGFTFSYRNFDEYENFIARVKKQQNGYYKNFNSDEGESVINSYTNINLGAA